MNIEIGDIFYWKSHKSFYMAVGLPRPSRANGELKPAEGWGIGDVTLVLLNTLTFDKSHTQMCNPFGTEDQVMQSVFCSLEAINNALKDGKVVLISKDLHSILGKVRKQLEK